MPWEPQVEQRPHPFGEAGVRSSLEEVCKRAAEGASEILADPKALTRVRTWSLDKIEEARAKGESFHRPEDRARILLNAVQHKLWVPDPIGIEHIVKAHHTACDKHDKDGVCIKGGDCDDLCVLLAACLMSVGLYTMIVGHSYTRDNVIGHVLCKVYFDGKWHYADPSPLGNGKYMPLGKSAPFTRERYYSMPTIKVVCDAASCDVQNFDPQELGFVEQGTFVGLNGIPVVEMPPVVEWLGEARAPVVEWLGEYKADDALSKEIIARKGDTSEESLKAYGQAAGAMGGGVACLAFGVSAPVAGYCAVFGGLIGGVIASMIPVAKGSELTDAVVDVWKNTTAPHLKWAQRALLAVKAYYVMREEAVDAAVAAGATPSWAESYLEKHGLTREPTKGRWAPRPERYNHPLVCTSEPCASVQSIVSASDWKECGAAKSVGINLECRTYLQLTYGPWPPVGGKTDKIDWGLVGWDEIVVEREMKQKYKASGCNMYADGTWIQITCPSTKPSAWAKESILKLKLVQAKMLVEAKNSGGALEYRSMSRGSSTGAGTKVLIGLSVAAAAAYAASELGWLTFLKRPV